MEKKHIYRRVDSIAEGLGYLNNDINTMFAFIPLQKNDFLEKFTRNIRDKELCKLFSAAFYEAAKPEIEEIFPEELSPFTITSANGHQHYYLTPSQIAQFNTISGKPVDLSAPLGHSIRTVAIQSDNRRSIGKELHRDETALTVNIYSEGDPLRYRLNDSFINIKAPAIFMHRGFKHPFGLDAAVEHQGKIQKGARANVAFDYCNHPASPDLNLLS